MKADKIFSPYMMYWVLCMLSLSKKKVNSIHCTRPTPLILFTILQDLFWFWWFCKHIFYPTQNVSSLLLSWLHTSTTSISSYSTTSTKDKYGMYLRYTSVLTRLHMPDKIRWEMGLFLTYDAAIASSSSMCFSNSVNTRLWLTSFFDIWCGYTNTVLWQLQMKLYHFLI